MRRVLIAGCGYLGQTAADLFYEGGWEVEGWTMTARSAEGLSAKSYRVAAVDISDPHQFAAGKGEFDAVIHCASTRGGDADFYRRVYLRGVRNLIERFAHAKILFTSSTSVYAQTTGEWVTEESPAAPAHERGKILRDAEEMVVARSGIVARMGGIYGPGRSALLRKVLNGEAVVDPEHDRFANQVHRDDGAAALFLLLNRGSSTGEIYNVVDDQPVLQSECYRWLAGELDRPAPPVGKSKLTRKRGQSNKRVSNAKLRGAGWSPRYPTFIEGMENSVLPNLAKLGA